MSSELSQTELVRAATNDPALSDKEVKLGNLTITIVDLPYDDYTKFLTMVQPVIEAMASRITAGVLASSDGLGISQLVKYSADNLPEMVRIVCKQTMPDITIDEIKKEGKNPFNMALVVIKQIEQNKIIEDITDFFEKILPLLAGKKDQ